MDFKILLKEILLSRFYYKMLICAVLKSIKGMVNFLIHILTKTNQELSGQLSAMLKGGILDSTPSMTSPIGLRF